MAVVGALAVERIGPGLRCLAPTAALIGLHLSRDAAVGAPVWSPASLLADLELRLGLPGAAASSASRVARYAVRLSAAARGSFYADSLAADRTGTARTLLAWRDELVLSGWTGAPVPGAGKRLDDLARAEADPLPLPVGFAVSALPAGHDYDHPRARVPLAGASRA